MSAAARKSAPGNARKAGKATPTPAAEAKAASTSPDAAASFSPATLLEIPEEYKKQLRQAFDMFDDAGKGFIPSHEAVVALYALGYDVSRVELQQLLQEIGAPGAEAIDFNEFYGILVLKMTKPETRSDSVRAFKQMDEEDKGYVDVANLRAIADSLRMELTDDELAEMLQFARSVGHSTVAPGSSEFDAKDALAVTEADYLRLMKRANLF